MQPLQLGCYITRASRDRGLEKLQRPGNWDCPVGFLACWLHSLKPRQPTPSLKSPTLVTISFSSPPQSTCGFLRSSLHLTGITGGRHAGSCANVELPLEISCSLP